MDNIFLKTSFLIMLLFSGVVAADSYPVVSYWQWGSQPVTRSSTESGTCALVMPFYSAASYTVDSAAYNDCILKSSGGSIISAVRLSNNTDCPSGGTKSGSSCIDVPACVSPQVRDANSPYSCISAPCAVGASAQLTQFTPVGTLLTLYIGKGPDLVQGGCTYTCNSEQTFEKYDTTGVYATYSCSGTGVVNNTATTVAKPTDSVAVVPTSGGQTCSSQTGKNVCVGGDIPAGCSYINGVKTCPSGTNSATVGTSPPLASTSAKNCGRVNGNVVCVQPSGATNNVMNAVSLSGSAAITFEQGVKTVSTVSPTVANPDGSTTQTTINTTNIYGEPDGVTTVDTSSTGVATTTKTGGATGSGSGGNDSAIADAAKSAALAECAKPENQGTLGCAGFGDIPTQETITTTAVSAALSVGSYDVGSCPAAQTITTTHGNITMSNTPICNLATGIKPLNLAIAYLVAGFIVFGAVRS